MGDQSRVANETVVFTDVVGSTELRSRIGDQRADELRRRHDQELTAIVLRHGGTVVKGLGDGIMATFSGTADALEAAVGIQKAIYELHRRDPVEDRVAIRVGLSSGDVSWEDDDCFGTPVVEASRLCGVAQGGEVLCAEVVRWLARGRTSFEFESVGDLDLKGLAEPVPTCSVLWQPDDDGASALPAELRSAVGSVLVGYRSVRDALAESLAELITGTGGVLVVSGVRGSGKTCLMAELVQHAHGEGVEVRYHSFGHELGKIVKVSEIVGVAHTRMVVIEHLEMADAEHLEELQHLTAHCPPGLLLVMTLRERLGSAPSDLAPLLGSLPAIGSRRLRLEGLSAAETAELVRESTDDAVDGLDGRGGLAALLHTATDGNPRLIHELLAAGPGDVRTMEALTIPESVRDPLRRDVDSLSPDARSLVQAASVIGTSVDLRLLQTVAPPLPLSDLIDEVESLGLLGADPSSVQVLRFTPPLVQRVIYEDLGVGRRGTMHAALAEQLDQRCQQDLENGSVDDQLLRAHHGVEAGVLIDPARVGRWVLAAGNLELGRSANQRASRWFQRGVDLVEAASSGMGRDVECDLRIGLGHAWRRAGRPEFVEVLDRAGLLATELGDGTRQARVALAGFIGAPRRYGEVDTERLRLIDSALASLGDHDVSLRARTLSVKAIELVYSGDRARVRSVAQDAVDLARSTGDPGVLAPCLLGQWIAIGTDDVAALRPILADLRRAVVDGSDWMRWQAASASFQVAMSTADRRRIDGAVEEERLLTTALADPRLSAMHHYHEAALNMVDGTLVDADLEIDLAGLIGEGLADHHANILYVLHKAFIEFFRPGTVGDDFSARAFALVSEDSALWRNLISAGMATIGMPDLAADLLQEALQDDFADLSRHHPWLHPALSYVHTVSVVGDEETAQVLYDRLLPFRGLMGTTATGFPVGPVGQYLANLARVWGEHELAIEHHEESVALCAGLGSEYADLGDLLGWAESLVALGSESEAAQILLEIGPRIERYAVAPWTEKFQKLHANL